MCGRCRWERSSQSRRSRVTESLHDYDVAVAEHDLVGGAAATLADHLHGRARRSSSSLNRRRGSPETLPRSNVAPPAAATAPVAPYGLDECMISFRRGGAGRCTAWRAVARSHRRAAQPLARPPRTPQTPSEND
jgi:hypothetical protein